MSKPPAAPGLAGVSLQLRQYIEEYEATPLGAKLIWPPCDVAALLRKAESALVTLQAERDRLRRRIEALEADMNPQDVLQAKEPE